MDHISKSSFNSLNYSLVRRDEQPRCLLFDNIGEEEGNLFTSNIKELVVVSVSR